MARSLADGGATPSGSTWKPPATTSAPIDMSGGLGIGQGSGSGTYGNVAPAQGSGGGGYGNVSPGQGSGSGSYGAVVPGQGSGGSSGVYTPPTPTPPPPPSAAQQAILNTQAQTRTNIANGSYVPGAQVGPSEATKAAMAAQAATPAPAAAPAMRDIAIPDPAADATYQAQKSSLMKALADYQNNQTLASNQYDTNYNDSLHKLGWEGDAAKGGFGTANAGAYAQSLGDNTSDYASRGLGHSSAMADSLGMVNKQFGDQKAGLDRAHGDFGNTQDAALTQYQNQNSATDHTDLLDAISRIAAQKGVDLSQVTPGKVNNIQVPA